MYRYRDHNGSTSRSLRAFYRHIRKVGVVHSIKGYVYFGRDNTHHIGVLIRGENGTMRLGGVSWGYTGQGSRGLTEVLKELNVPQSEIDRVQSLEWPNWNKTQHCWEIQLEPVAA